MDGQREAAAQQRTLPTPADFSRQTEHRDFDPSVFTVSIGLWVAANLITDAPRVKFGWLFVTWMPSLLQKNYGLDLKKSIVPLRGDAVLAR